MDKNLHVLIPGACGYVVMCQGKIIVTDGIRVSNLLTLKWADCCGLSRWSVPSQSSYKRKAEEPEPEKDMKMEAELGVSWPQAKGCRQPPGVGESKKQTLPPETPEGACLCGYFHLSSMRPTSHF